MVGKENELYWSEISRINLSDANIVYTEKASISRETCIGALDTSPIKRAVFNCNDQGFFSCMDDLGVKSCGKTLSDDDVCMSPLKKASKWRQALVECAQKKSSLVDMDKLLKADLMEFLPGVIYFNKSYVITYNISLTFQQSKTFCNNIFQIATLHLENSDISDQRRKGLAKFLSQPVWIGKGDKGKCHILTLKGDIRNETCTGHAAPLCFLSIKSRPSMIWKGKVYTHSQKLLSVMIQQTYDSAQDSCRLLSPGSKLVEIYTRDQWNMTQNLMDINYWVGGKDFMKNRTFVWEHNRTAEIHHNLWRDDTVYERDGHCVALNISSGLLENHQCDRELHVLCEKSFCDDETWIKCRDKCFKTFAIQDWQGAKSTCQASNASLIEWHSKTTQDKISKAISLDILKGTSTHGYVGTSNPLGTPVDGSPLAFSRTLALDHRFVSHTPMPFDDDSPVNSGITNNLYWNGGRYNAQGDGFFWIKTNKWIRENWWNTTLFGNFTDVERCIVKSKDNFLNVRSCNVSSPFVCQKSPVRHFTPIFIGYDKVNYTVKVSMSSYANLNSKQTHDAYSCGVINKNNDFTWEGHPCDNSEHFICRKLDGLCPEVKEQGIRFPQTSAGKSLNVSCGTKYNGVIIRRCTEQGFWSDINLENCTRNDLGIIQETVNKLQKTNETVQIQASVKIFATQLANALKNDSILNGNEIKNIVDTMKLAKEKIVQSESIIDVETLKKLTFIANSLITSNDNSVKKDISQSTGFSLITTMESLTNEVLRNNNENVTNIEIHESNLYVLLSSSNDDIDISGKYLTHSSEERENLSHTPSFQLHLSGRNLNETTPYSVVVFKNYSDFVSLDVKEIDRYSTTTKTIGSAIVSFSLRKEHVLKEPLYLNFTISANLSSDVICVFLDRYKSSTFVWSTRGCQLIGVSDNVVYCKCDHLTSFAVLVNMGNSPV